MLRALITPLTLYNVLKDREVPEDLFEDLALPTRPFTNRGYEDLYLTGWDIDKDTLVDNILLETAELNCIYTDPDFMKFAIQAWSEKELPVWQELYETLFYKYNPIWNKDGTFKHSAIQTRNLASGESISETDSTQRSNAVTETIERNETSIRTITRENDGDVTETVTHNTSTDTENKVAAYNSSTYENRDKTKTDNTGTDTTVTDYDTLETTRDNLTAHDDDTERHLTEIGSGSGSRSQTTNGSDTGTISDAVTDTEQGNIGVTMSQALVESQRALVKFNIYDYIIDSFKARFCILVY